MREASSIMDVKFSGEAGQSEHPFEQMAYEFEHILA